MKLVVTFDGPVACGKSTLAKKVAQRVDYIYLSTGLLYRAVAYRVRDMGLESLSDNENTMFHVAKCQHYQFKIIDGESRLFLNDVDRTDEVKDDSLSLLASTVSRYQRIRVYLLDIQRRVARGGGVIVEGRDTGRVVFPKAHLKFWLTADIRFRAKMRQRDLREAGKTISFREVWRQTLERDEQDMCGDNPSLVQTPDMLIMDTTNKDLDELAIDVSRHIRELEMKV